MTDNVRALAEMQQSAFVKASRRRGGQIRGRSALRDAHGTFKRGCRLCIDPTISDPLKEEIIAHISHRDTSHKYEVKGNAILAHVKEDEVQTAQNGDQVIECDECNEPHVVH